MPTLHISKKSGTFPVPVSFVDQYMGQANATFVKVYLYALCHSFKNDGTSLTLASIASALGILESDVVQAFEYWDSVSVVSFRHSGEQFELEFLDLGGKSTRPAQAKDFVISPRFEVNIEETSQPFHLVWQRTQHLLL